MCPAPAAPGPSPARPRGPRPLLVLLLLACLGGTMTRAGPGPAPAPAPGSPLQHDDYDEDDGPSPADEHDDYPDNGNHTESPLGATLGGPCTDSCSSSLQHVRCSRESQRCECESRYPVEVGPTRGCTMPAGLGEQCLYQAACQHWDSHSRCTQVEHNALCQCEPGFHTVHRAGRRSFCSEDLVLLTADLPTLLGVATGIALFTGVICFVLRLFVGGRPRDHFANANLAPSHILFSSDTGSEMSLRQLTAGKVALSLCRAGPSRLPLTGRSASRSGSQRSVSGSLRGSMRGSQCGSHLQGGLQGHGGVLVPSSGSRRQSLASVHSSASSTKSMGFGMRRFEREREQRLRRQQQRDGQGQGGGGAQGGAPAPPASLGPLGGAVGPGMQTPGSVCSASGDELGLVGLGAGRGGSRGASPSPGPSPNPLSPMSTDRLLPALDQLVEDVVWTTQSSSQRTDHMMAAPGPGPGPSGYRQAHAHLQRAGSGREQFREQLRDQLRGERARQLHVQLQGGDLSGQLSGQLHAAQMHHTGAGVGQLTVHRGAGSRASEGAVGPCTSPDGR